MEKSICIDFIFYECRQRFTFSKFMVKTFSFDIDTIIFNQTKSSRL